MNARISELLSQLMTIQGELAKLRAECTHSSGYKVGWWSWRIGAIDASRICNDCEMSIPGITEEERKTLGDFHKTCSTGVTSTNVDGTITTVSCNV